MNKKFSEAIDPLHKGIGSSRNNGFSMIETIWVAVLIIALATGGLLAYSHVIGNAAKASLESEAAAVYTAALSAEMDGNDSTTSAEIESKYNLSQEEITVIIIAGD